ncbi:MAG: T9SS type A sorting domain-containing protein [Bacteroides sp.]|nr:T9SS type A sorting domain-containing protein [Bacteroides sp.]
MKKLKLFLFTMFISGLMLSMSAQDTIRSLIISETRTGGRFDHYIEMANVGTDIIDLSKFTIAWINNGEEFRLEDGQFRLEDIQGEDRIYRMSGMLAQGETWTMMNVGDNLAVDGFPYHRLDIMAKADLLIHGSNSTGYIDYAIPEWEIWGKDSMDVFYNLGYNEGKIAYVIFCHLDNGDSIMIDQYNLNLDENLETIKEYEDVAGIPEATGEYTFVRKATIKQGNMDWQVSKGVSLEDSEWIPIPNHPYKRSFTTFGVHGDFHIDLESTEVDIDKANGKLTVPWGIMKGDSILNKMTVGPGQGWQYIQDTTSFTDSTHTIIQNGDILSMYAAGNVLEKIDFELVVLEAAANEARVYPRQDKRFSDINPIGLWVQPYYVTAGEPVIDTIGNVPYDLRVDSLYKYLEKAPTATWDIVWKDGTERADLQNGDILKVTSEDKSIIKDYYIDVQDYAASDNVLLNAITWPDKSDFIENWKGDTIPQFTPDKTTYSVTLPYGTTSVPALVAHPANINSRVQVKRAVSLSGSLEERSSVFTVTSESDTLWKEYTVIFDVEKDPKKVQTYKGTPFFSEAILRMNSSMGMLEVVNPGNVDLDLSEYLILRSTSANPAIALERLNQDPLEVDEDDFEDRYESYVPGYKFQDDTTNWLLNPGILQVDGEINPVIKPGDVFVMCATTSDRKRYYTDEMLAKIDKRWDGVERTSIDPLGVKTTVTPPYLLQGANGIFLFHIENDSVLEGKKAVGDPQDYKMVDAIVNPLEDGTFNIAGRELDSRFKGRIRPKTNIYQGVESTIECAERFGTTADSSGWIVEESGEEFEDGFDDYVGSHVMDPVTVYISTVSSSVYLVSDGYKEVQSIQGDLSSTTVEGFFENVDQADPMQVFSLLSGADGSVKDSTSAVAAGDTLMVISADGVNTTKYELIDIPLDSDAVLTAANDPSNLTISHSGEEGTIEGAVYGGLLKDLLAEVKVPDLAVMNIIDSNGELIPMQYMGYDSLKVDTKVGDDIYFEVVAQDLVTIITYKLEPEILASDAFVISSIYEVNDDIDGLADGTSTQLFWMNIEVVKGATATLLSKLGDERMDGFVSYDDVLRVVSEDGSNTVTYFITFVNENNPDANESPVIELAFSDTTFADPGTIMVSATATDDDLPPPPALTYLWEVTSGSASDVVIANADQLSTDVSFNAKGNYELTLSVSDGAVTSQAVVTVTVGAVNIHEILTPALHIYPNPAREKLTLELSNMPGNASMVTIYKITGSAVYNARLVTERTEIDVSTFNAGLYFIKVDSGNSTFTRRFEIQD